MNKIREFTYLECFDCGSVHRMDYISKSKMYICKQCDKKINYKDADKYEILFDDEKFTNLL